MSTLRVVSFFAELKRRNVFRVGVAYLIGAWVIMQVADVVLNNIDAPGWVFKALMLVLAIGLPVTLFIAWAFELTPDGVMREENVDRSQSTRKQTGRKLDRGIIVILIIALGYFVWESRFESEDKSSVAIKSVNSIDDQQTPAATVEAQSVAVLPFVNMSSDPEQEYFSDGITEEIINALVKIPGLAVPARTSVFGFKGQLGDVKSIGQQLGVAHVLEGSIRSQGNQVRITAQLIKIDDGFHLWSQTYDRNLDNIFVVQEEIASAIAEVLTGQLGLGESSVPNQTRNMEAYDLYLKGRTLLRQRDKRAVDVFKQATEADPDFAPAWAALAIAYQSEMNQDMAMQTAEFALQLDPDNVDALDALASVLRAKMRWAEAEHYFERALAIDPHSAELLEDYAEFLAHVGRTDEALEVTSRGFEIDPNLIPMAAAHVEALLSTGNEQEALIIFEKMMPELDSDYWLFHASFVYLSQNNFVANEASLDKLAIPEDMLPTVRAFFSDQTNRQTLSALKAWYTEEAVTAGHRYWELLLAKTLLVYAGESDYVLDILLLSLAAGDQNRQGLDEWGWTPVFRPLRQNPRYETYLQRAGLIEYWDATSWPEWCWRNDNSKVVCK